MMKIHEIAKAAGVSVRTLHYYDEIGLLPPCEVTESGYRLYDDRSLQKLQQILFFREMDFPLSEIKQILTDPNFDLKKALTAQKEVLLKKRQRIDNLISLTEHVLKGEKTMSFQEFDTSEIEKAKKSYAEEVKRRWGHTDAYAESEQKSKNYTPAKWQAMNEQCSAIFQKFATHMDKAPSDPEVQTLVAEWQAYISENFYDCSKEMLSCLGQMYTADTRFEKYFDGFQTGLASFISEAIKIYCTK